MHRLYQWLSGRARFFRSQAEGRGNTRTIRTEVTVERRGVTVVIGDPAASFDSCPLCGQKLDQAQGQKKLRPSGTES